MRTTRSRPHVDNPTAGTSPSRTGILFLIHTVHQDLTAHALLPHSYPTTTETVKSTAAPLQPRPDPSTRTPTFDPDGVTRKVDISRGDGIMLTSDQATKKSSHEKVRPVMKARHRRAIGGFLALSSTRRRLEQFPRDQAKLHGQSRASIARVCRFPTAVDLPRGDGAYVLTAMARYERVWPRLVGRE
jgi:hypothetical protein